MFEFLKRIKTQLSGVKLMEFTDTQKQILLEKKSIAQVGIVRKKSHRPHVSPVWFNTTENDLKNGILYFNSATGRVKPKNLSKGSNIYLSILDPDNDYTYVGIDGTIKDIIVGDEAENHIDQLAKKYLGKDEYPYRNDKEKRIKYVVKIESLLKRN